LIPDRVGAILGSVNRRLPVAALAAAGVAIAVVAVNWSSTAAVHPSRNSPPAGLTVYGKTLWELDALLHDTFGPAGSGLSLCLRQGRYADNFTRNCGSLAATPYWKDVFASARHSRFKLVRRKHAPALGNVVPVAVNGRYVFCGAFPTAWKPLARRSKHKWLVVIHGWVLTPFTCFG
jgi:hypothetical protein